jgi:hypothetical protein|tara:strand:- start:6213 stop:6596 length:384 start_codon:yes stop_codon:yes gene_type:complete
MEGTHNFKSSGGDSLKVALYTSSATINATTTAYSATNEISGTNYSSGGAALTNVSPTTTSTIAFVDFSDVSWTTASFTARGALIYNSTDSNKAIAVLDFGADYTVTAGTFTIVWPAASSSAAILRIA